jgi:phosphomannomutase
VASRRSDHLEDRSCARSRSARGKNERGHWSGSARIRRPHCCGVGRGTPVCRSASHSVYTFNGLKLFDSTGTRLPGTTQAAVERDVDEFYYSSATFPYHAVAVDAGLATQYLTHLRRLAQRRLNGAPASITVDCAHGATSAIVRRVFEDTSVICRVDNNIPNGFNINDGCGSLHRNGWPKRRGVADSIWERL